MATSINGIFNLLEMELQLNAPLFSGIILTSTQYLWAQLSHATALPSQNRISAEFVIVKRNCNSGG